MKVITWFYSNAELINRAIEAKVNITEELSEEESSEDEIEESSEDESNEDEIEESSEDESNEDEGEDSDDALQVQQVISIKEMKVSIYASN